MKKMIWAVVLGACMQPAFAEVQVSSKVAAVLGGDLTSFGSTPGVSATEQAFVMDTSDPNYTDWNDPGQEFTTICAAYPIGNIVIIDTQSDTGKLAMSMLVNAKLTGQSAMIFYHTEVDAGFLTGYKCVADAVALL